MRPPIFKGVKMKKLQVRFTYTLDVEIEDEYIDAYVSMLSMETPEKIKAFIDDGVYIKDKRRQESKVTGFKYKVEDL